MANFVTSSASANTIKVETVASANTASRVGGAYEDLRDDVLLMLGVGTGDTLMSSFTGSTIGDDISVKAALQALETAFEALSAATAISPASDDATGAVGTATEYAREDHKHPAQGVSADAEQLLKLGTDDLHMLDPDDMLSTDSDNMLIKGTDGKLTASLDAATVGVPLTGDYVLGWTNGTLTIFPK